jgi:phosphotransferase system HPr-like phosphotransfer protein
MAQRWVTEEELNSMQNQYAEGGNVQESNPLMEFYNQLPPELQEKIQMLPPEKQQEVLMQLMQKYQEQGQQQFQEGGEVDPQQIMQMVAQALQQGMQPEEVVQMLVEQGIPQEQAMQIIQQVMQSVQQPQEQQFAMGGKAQGIPVEAERNENITVQDGQEPQVNGGYLEKQSYNPVTGQATYEIPDNEHSETHDNGGVNMELSQGDVVNSDKTKIPTDFKVYGKSFKGKTFKEASDYLAKQETKIQDDFAEKVKEGKTEK